MAVAQKSVATFNRHGTEFCNARSTSHRFGTPEEARAFMMGLFVGGRNEEIYCGINPNDPSEILLDYGDECGPEDFKDAMERAKNLNKPKKKGKK